MKNVNPFPGLRPFEAAESHLFFGREAATDELLRKLRTNRFIAVVGTSGSGKSSLVRAGMLPDLYGGFMVAAGSSWRVAVLRPGDAPIHALAEALAAPDVFGTASENYEMQTAITETVLRRGAPGLIEATRQARMVTQENLLVVVDQFEELFRFKQLSKAARAADEAAAFIKLLLEATRQDDYPIYVVLTMRSEYLGDCTQFRDLPEAINAGQYLIPRLTRDQRRQAITGPTAVGGTRMTPRLVQRLLNDVGDNPDQLPILQHAMMRTWDYWADDHEDGEAIDLHHYEATGGMEEALSRHADEAFSELADKDHQKIAERLFKRLTGRGADNREIRFPTRLADLVAVTGAPENKIVAVIDVFRREGRSFLMPPSDVQLSAETLIDISHESLIRIWRRLRQWVGEESRSAGIYQRLAATSALYKKKEAGLWRNPDLQIALAWHNRNHPNAQWAKRYHPGFADAVAFLNRSRVAARRRRSLITIIILIVPLLAIGYGANKLVGKLEGLKLAKQKILAEKREVLAEKQEVEAELDEKVAELNEIEDLADKKMNPANDWKTPEIKEMLEETSNTKKAEADDPPADKLKAEKPIKTSRRAKAELLTPAKQKVAETKTKVVKPEAVKPPAQPESAPVAQRGMSEFKAIILTCKNVSKLECVSAARMFPPGKVYAFTRIKAPNDATLTLRWYDANNNKLGERNLKIRKNLVNGFRTYAWKTIHEAGKYNVRLYKGWQEIERSQEFTIVAQN